MANLDSTVLAAILLALSGHTTQTRLWDEMIGTSEAHAAKRRRFFRGQSPNRQRQETQHRSWWPIKDRDDREDFERYVKKYFLSCIDPEHFPAQRQKILDICQALHVSSAARRTLAAFQEPDELIEYLFLCAKTEQEAGSIPQIHLVEHPELAAAAPPPSSAPAGPQALIEEGSILTQVPNAFPPRRDHSTSPFFSHFAAVRGGGERWQVPYKELFGSAKAGQGEYVEGENLTYAYEDWQADLRAPVSSLDFDQELEAERTAAAALGYRHHPPKLCLAHYLEWKEEGECGSLSSALTLTFGQSGYLEHRVYQKDLAQNPKEQQALQKLFHNAKGNIHALRYCPWAACGGGVWVVTRDGFLVLSLRTNVAEEAGKLSYSASGSYGRYTQQNGQQQDNTPGLAMCKELWEELGLENISPQDLTLISLGIDLNRCLIQFSYLLESPLTAEDILFCRQDLATTADEQIICFAPLDTPDLCWSLLEQCEFEPGAAYSLVRLLQKRFGLS